MFASTWGHYKLKPSDGGRPKSEEVDEEFWLRFRHGAEYMKQLQGSILVTKRNRENRVNSKYKAYRGGSYSLTTICQKLPSTGESVNDAKNMDNTPRGAEDGMFGGFLMQMVMPMEYLLEITPHPVTIYLHVEISLFVLKEVA